MNKPRAVFDITNVIALLLIGVGLYNRFSWPTASVLLGALLLALNLAVLRVTRG